MTRNSVGHTPDELLPSVDILDLVEEEVDLIQRLVGIELLVGVENEAQAPGIELEAFIFEVDVDDPPEIRVFLKLLNEREQEPGLTGAARADHGYDLRRIQRNLKVAANDAGRDSGGMKVG